MIYLIIAFLSCIIYFLFAFFPYKKWKAEQEYRKRVNHTAYSIYEDDVERLYESIRTSITYSLIVFTLILGALALSYFFNAYIISIVLTFLWVYQGLIYSHINNMLELLILYRKDEQITTELRKYI